MVLSRQQDRVTINLWPCSFQEDTCTTIFEGSILPVEPQSSIVVQSSTTFYLFKPLRTTESIARHLVWPMDVLGGPSTAANMVLTKYHPSFI